MSNTAPVTVYVVNKDGSRSDLIEAINSALQDFSKQGDDLQHRVARTSRAMTCSLSPEPGNPVILVVIDWAGCPEGEAVFVHMTPGLITPDVIVATVVSGCLDASTAIYWTAKEEADENATANAPVVH